MVLGFTAVLLAFGAFVAASNHQVQLRKFKRQYPGLSVVAILVAGYILMCIFGSIIVFMFGIALPIFSMHFTSIALGVALNNASDCQTNGLYRTPSTLTLTLVR